MSSYKLLDVYEEIEEDVEFGTCDLCFSVGTLSKQIVKLENLSTGKVAEVEMGTWSWGDYFDEYLDEDLDILDFAEFLPSYKMLPEDATEITPYDINDAVRAFKDYEEKLKPSFLVNIRYRNIKERDKDFVVRVYADNEKEANEKAREEFRREILDSHILYYTEILGKTGGHK